MNKLRLIALAALGSLPLAACYVAPYPPDGGYYRNSYYGYYGYDRVGPRGYYGREEYPHGYYYR